MHIIDISNYMEVNSDVDEVWLLSTPVEVCCEIYDEMATSGTLWLFVPHRMLKQPGTITPMQLADEILVKSEYYLKNIITIHHHVGPNNLLRGAYEEIYLFAKDPREYAFNKDAIRIEPVYKGAEWFGTRDNGQTSYGDRITRRYNEQGKDPGNVWVHEVRTDTAGQVLDRSEPFPRKEAVRRCIRAGSNIGDPVFTMWPSDEVEMVIKNEERAFERLNSNDYLPGDDEC